MEIMTVGGGCFWCVEAIFQRIQGVEKVVSGYSGGDCPGHPTYREVCSGRTGHAEVVQVTYSPEVISYEELLIIFMTSHDPTQFNGQGADLGSQYRSVIYYHSEQQKTAADEVIRQLNPHFDNKIVTEISAAEIFYAAEEYHQNYYDRNSRESYCSFVITPKLNKLRKRYADKLKPNVVNT
ncbi:MAG: peptide-methionine (S)-S-oxide reductase MsrA [Bacteroidota bacterium]